LQNRPVLLAVHPLACSDSLRRFRPKLSLRTGNQSAIPCPQAIVNREVVTTSLQSIVSNILPEALDLCAESGARADGLTNPTTIQRDSALVHSACMRRAGSLAV